MSEVTLIKFRDPPLGNGEQKKNIGDIRDTPRIPTVSNV